MVCYSVAMTQRKSDLAWANDHRYVCTPDGKPMPSVTTIIGQIDKPQLIDAKARLSLELGSVKAAQAVWDEKAALGTRIHDAAAARALGQEIQYNGRVSDEPYLEALQRFFEDFEPHVLLSEATLINPAKQYGGRCDLIAGLPYGSSDRQTWLLDYKTGGHYCQGPTLQLCAYSRCERALYEGEWLAGTFPLPPIDKCGIVWLNGDGTYQLQQVPVDDAAWWAFLSLRYLYDWRKAQESWERASKKASRHES